MTIRRNLNAKCLPGNKPKYIGIKIDNFAYAKHRYFALVFHYKSHNGYTMTNTVYAHYTHYRSQQVDMNQVPHDLRVKWFKYRDEIKTMNEDMFTKNR